MDQLSPSIDLETVVVASENQVSANLTSGIAGELVVLDLNAGVYFEFNPVGAFIWRAIQEPRSVAEVLDGLKDSYDVQAEECQADLMRILSELLERQLIRIQDA